MTPITTLISGVKQMARPKGLEPLAYCLEGSCSILLSYGRINKKMKRNRNRTRVTGLEASKNDRTMGFFIALSL